jgi:hypothetical protein
VPDAGPFSAAKNGTRVRLRVRPGGRRNAIVGVHGGALKITVTAAPERGKANEAVVELLARALGVPPSHVEIVSGHVSPDKVAIVPLPVEVVEERLAQAPDRPVRDRRGSPGANT